MDPVATIRSIVKLISDAQKLAEQVKSNQEDCEEFAKRLNYLSSIFNDENLKTKGITAAIIQEIHAFLQGANEYLEALTPSSAPKKNSTGLLGGLWKGAKRGAKAAARVVYKLRNCSKIAAHILDFHKKLDRFLDDLSKMLNIDNHSNGRSDPAHYLAKSAIALRNTAVMLTNSMMTDVTNGEALPEDIDDLPACVDHEVSEAIAALATKAEVSPSCLPIEASAAATEQLRVFVVKQVEEIRTVSRRMAEQQATRREDTSFGGGEDISHRFVSCDGRNDGQLGEIGGYGRTYKRRYQPTGEIYALKEIDVRNARRRGVDEHRLKLEAETLQSINHPNVVRCYHSFFSSDGLRFYLVMELVDGQTLDQVLHTSWTQQTSPDLLVKWLQQIARALVYMHGDCNIVHRDLKPENVMVTRMQDIKLIDFGMARFMTANDVTMTSGVGTQFYMSYAKKHKLYYDGRDDVWAVGCIVLELLLGMPMITHLSLCDDDRIRALRLQEAKIRHDGIGGLLEIVLAKTEMESIPSASLLLMLVCDDASLLSRSAGSYLADMFSKLSTAGPTSATVAPTPRNPTPKVSGKYSKEDAKAELIQWLLVNVSGFTDEDAEQCASNCIRLKCNTIALLGEEYVEKKQEGASMAVDFVNSLVEGAPLRRRLRQTLENTFCSSSAADAPPQTKEVSLPAPPPLPPVVSTTTGHVFTSNEALKQAVDLWCDKNTRARAEGEYGHISTWNTSQVTSMKDLFGEKSDFNDDISHWDVSNVTSMDNMFRDAKAFNQPICSWNVSKVTSMECMFCDAKAFNQPIDTWNVSNVTNMYSMFCGAKAFNQPIGTWDVSSVTNMDGMFYYALAFNQPIGTWDVSNVTSMDGLFDGAQAFNQPIGTWDVSSVTSMEYMFSHATAFNQPIGIWDVSKVTRMDSMFWFATAFNQPIGAWDVSNVTSMDNMFYGSGYKHAHPSKKK